MVTTRFPGADLVEQGFADLALGQVTVAALLVAIGAPRFRALGRTLSVDVPNAEERLFALLSASHGDGAHSAYNALVRQLVSYQRAAACAT